MPAVNIDFVSPNTAVKVEQKYTKKINNRANTDSINKKCKYHNYNNYYNEKFLNS